MPRPVAASRPGTAASATAAPAGAASAARRPDGIARFGRTAARVAWALAAVVLLGLGAVQAGTGVLAVGSLPNGGARHTVALAALAVLLLACAVACVAAVPGAAARALRRRLPVRRTRHPRALLVVETAARLLAGAALLSAALWAHGTVGSTRILPAGTAAELGRFGLHPAALIIAGGAAAALSFRWARARHRAAGAGRVVPPVRS